MRVDQKITIIIPTTCEAKREVTLVRALASLRGQTIGGPSILVVANGSRVDNGVLQRVCAAPDVRLSRLEEGSLPRALAHGRASVATPYFGFLDDDDEYLPQALSLRLDMLERYTQAVVCATDGYDHLDGVDRLRETVSPNATKDPLRGLLQANWLASCGGLYRTDLVPVSYFDGETKYYEWTLLAYKLAASSQVLLLETPTYRLHVSSGSLSRSEAYRLAEPEVLKKICSMDLPADVRSALRRRIGNAYHGLAGYFLRSGRTRDAWRFHFHSLTQAGGWRYAPYTAKLLKFWI